MAIYEENERYIIKSTLKECKDELFSKYGNKYRPINKENVIVPGGFFNLGKRGAVKLTYVLTDQPCYSNESGNSLSENEILAQNRAEILKDNSDKLLNAQINQINQMNNLSDEMRTFMSDIKNKMENISGAVPESHESIKKIEELLEQNEFSNSYIRMIVDKIRNAFSLDELDDFDLIQRRVVDWIGESISIQQDKVVRPPHVVIIVGPTGVGKTTTLVKLAYQFAVKFKEKHPEEEIWPELRFITTDTMKVGAMEQLTRFGSHLHIPVYEAGKNQKLINLFNENKENVDAIFIDTSGFSPNDATNLAHVKLMLDVPGLNPDVYLAVAASTKARDLNNIMKNYEPFGYNSVIVTKCDETEQIGNVLSILNERHKSVSYITYGQIASRDIQKANVVEFLKRLDGFTIDRVHIENLFGE